MIFWLLIYVAIGATNYLIFLTEGKSMLTGHPVMAKDILAEAAFFVFAWPVQLGFKILVGINVATDWLLGKLMG